MGQKVNPVGMRIGITRDWTSNWYADKKDFADRLNEDLNVRQLLQKRLKGAAISRIQIERPARNAKIIIHSARPGVIIGKKGGEIEVLRDEIYKVMKVPVHITIEEVGKPELDAKLVAENIAQQLERRVMFRRAMKRAVQNTLRQGALGVKISVNGRLGGAEIARTEWYREGRVPLHTFRADIDYATASAKTTYGIIGVKVWIFKGQVRAPKSQPEEATPQETEEEVK
ncbi:30S ribosomal protein S3 [Coxiella endosymbiont of Ornithodoros amblus]|uniref:30S ribosomal protein S3 n=1 Tax=Coxiella endosymbiont of Ornithodoros amblus TaxID=1656166 RepID=UPI00244E3261|nr:30S ribosomal protein S3 [Coxiella endosymbiont of Ornithodoros amblus]MBW5802545.1 30S ribosomal protein S3 [Coxiella endosymbiont of Ornithodoros amblus]